MKPKIVCYLLFLFSCCTVKTIASVEYAPTVTLKNGGQVRGRVEEAFDSANKVYLYEGVRYGRAERFEPPKPANEPWIGVYNATEPRDACPQVVWEHQSEDCLFLNIWKSEVKKENLSVMFWIHGGGFASGSIFDAQFDGRYIAGRGDVIVVSVAYRLGPLGFLITGQNGNFGFQDQILALHWVRDNIGAFGGNPNDVTIFGESAGSSSISALVLSPLTAGLYHRAMTQSGSIMGIASIQSQINQTENFASKLNCSSSSISNTVKCLKAVPLTDLIQAAKGERFWPVFGDQVLPLEPYKALKNGNFNHVDLLYGLCNNEASGYVSHLFGSHHLTLESTKHIIVELLKQLDSSLSAKTVEQLVTFYMSKLGPSPTQDDFKIVVADIASDQKYVCPTVLFAEYMAQHSPAHSYYSYRLMQNGEDHHTWKGVGHTTDLRYLFSPAQYKSKPAELQLSRDMISAWTSFAKSGHPGKIDANVQWEEAFTKNSTSTRFMFLKSSNFHMVDDYYRARCDQLWKQAFFPHK